MVTARMSTVFPLCRAAAAIRMAVSTMSEVGYWWSASEDFSYYAYFRCMLYYLGSAYWYGISKSFLFSVRCLRE